MVNSNLFKLIKSLENSCNEVTEKNRFLQENLVNNLITFNNYKIRLIHLIPLLYLKNTQKEILLTI